LHLLSEKARLAIYAAYSFSSSPRGEFGFAQILCTLPRSASQGIVSFAQNQVLGSISHTKHDTTVESGNKMK